MTVEQRSSELELPALLNIGTSYDINITNRHRIIKQVHLLLIHFKRSI